MGAAPLKCFIFTLYLCSQTSPSDSRCCSELLGRCCISLTAWKDAEERCWVLHQVNGCFWVRQRFPLSAGITYFPGNLSTQWLSVLAQPSLRAVAAPGILPSDVSVPLARDCLHSTDYPRSDLCKPLRSPASRVLAHSFFPAKGTALVAGLSSDAHMCLFFCSGPIQL